mmetsp:Transcript_804/g.2363  ORF Transcript_804/g.2363 Transcript_804/m.2363 type:complete len:204 (+) Transcript_804:46-657(+)
MKEERANWRARARLPPGARRGGARRGGEASRRRRGGRWGRRRRAKTATTGRKPKRTVTPKQPARSRAKRKASGLRRAQARGGARTPRARRRRWVWVWRCEGPRATRSARKDLRPKKMPTAEVTMAQREKRERAAERRRLEADPVLRKARGSSRVRAAAGTLPRTTVFQVRNMASGMREPARMAVATRRESPRSFSTTCGTTVW